jgi:large subunit ribosomal protein L25
MEKTTLKASVRTEINKKEKNKIRNQGRAPGVFYSKHSVPIHIDVADKAIKPLVFTSKTHLISLEIDGHDEQECIIKDVQFDPVTDSVLHFDLLGLTKGEKITLEVPVQLVGTPIGVKEGGIIQHIRHKLEIECLPRNIPEHIVIDVSGLKLGDSFHISDLQLEDIEFIETKEAMIVQVTHAKIREEAAPVEEGEEEESAEPEVIGKGKAEEEEEEEK